MQDNWRIPGQPFKRMISGREVELKALNIEEKAKLNAVIDAIKIDSSTEDVTAAYDAVAECIVSIGGVQEGSDMKEIMRVQEQAVMLAIWHELIIGNSLSENEAKNSSSSSVQHDAQLTVEVSAESGVETKEDAGITTHQ